jgi:hypothetical protein
MGGNLPARGGASRGMPVDVEPDNGSLPRILGSPRKNRPQGRQTKTVTFEMGIPGYVYASRGTAGCGGPAPYPPACIS